MTMVVEEIFESVILNLAMSMSLNTLKKLPKEELSNMVIEYQNKYDIILSNINTELTSLRDRFMKMESQFLATTRVNNDLLKQNHILERKCTANEQYSRRYFEQ